MYGVRGVTVLVAMLLAGLLVALSIYQHLLVSTDQVAHLGLAANGADSTSAPPHSP
jgi:hypothetical protein